jgi:hypothetical protein
MTKAIRTVRTFTEIADLIAEETAQPTDSFSAAFAEHIEGFRIGREEESSADMPDPLSVQLATEMLVRTVFDVLQNTRLESVADRIAWGVVHSLHRVADQLSGEADRAAIKVKDLVRDADGSEVMTGELEEAQTLCQSLDEVSDAVACMRDHAASTYHAETGRPWSSPRGSQVSSRRTASVVSGLDFLAARRQRRFDAHNPQGPVILFSGGQLWEDHGLLTRTLDGIKKRIPNMVLVTTAQRKGCDAIAASWAARTHTPLIAFSLNTRLENKAAFVRNQQMLGLRPVEAVVCQGSGIQSNLARMVRERGVPHHFFRLEDQGRDAA